MSIFTQTFKSVDHQISELEQQLSELQSYRDQLQTANETTKSSLQALSEAMRSLKPEHADEVKREITRYLGLDNLPAQPTIESTTSNGNDNGGSSQ
jgi:chromosome segregation ATPase